MMPSKTLTIAGESCSGGKFSKERVTVLLTVFGDGAIAKPLVIGKAAKPRCFANLKIENLGVEYYSNKKAWMTGLIFHQFLRKMNEKMVAEDRKILLFLDNASSHPNLQFSNIKLVFLPPNTTSKLQPLDAGIIANMKVNYRKLMLQNLLVEMENCDSVSALTKRINILDAIQFLKIACNQISQTTIIKCFLNCGFIFENSDSDDEEPNQPIVELQNLIHVAFGTTYNAIQYVSCDENVITEIDSIDLNELIRNENDEGRPEVVTISDDETGNEDNKVGNKEVLAAFKTLEIYGRQFGNEHFFETIYNLKASYVQSKSFELKKKQSSILDFFNTRLT